MIWRNEVFVVPRNAANETSQCTGKKIGAYEMSGIIFVGDVDEPLLEQAGLDPVLDDVEIFSQLNYGEISSALAGTAVGLGGLENEI